LTHTVFSFLAVSAPLCPLTCPLMRPPFLEESPSALAPPVTPRYFNPRQKFSAPVLRRSESPFSPRMSPLPSLRHSFFSFPFLGSWFFFFFPRSPSVGHFSCFWDLRVCSIVTPPRPLHRLVFLTPVFGSPRFFDVFIIILWKIPPPPFSHLFFDRSVPRPASITAAFFQH